MFKATSHLRISKQGQSLVELVLVMIVLVPIMLAAAYGGMAMFEGTMASEAIREPASAKGTLAGTSGAVTSAQLLSMAQGGVNSSFQSGGGALDSVNVSNPISSNTVLLIGQKQSVQIPFINLNLTFTVVQPMQRGLLEANTAARTSSPGQAPAYLAGMAGPPSQNPAYAGTQLPDLIQCAAPGTTVTGQTADALFPDAPSRTYDSRATFSVPVSMGIDTMMTFTTDSGVVSGCQSAGNSCSSEQTDLLYKAGTPVPGCPDASNVPQCITSTYDNPKGAPGQRLTIHYDAITNTETKTFSTLFGPPHGLYYDPTNNYAAPPNTFVSDCQQRKIAECKVQAAAAKANAFMKDYQSTCQ